MPPADSGPRPDGGFDACEGVFVRSMSRVRPADVIVVVDNSGSMRDEAALVQEHLDDLGRTVAARGIDMRMVLISRTTIFPEVISGIVYFDIPPELAADGERFMAIDQLVGASTLMAETALSYPLYRDFLREDAATHLIMVSDDESRVWWEDFRDAFESPEYLGHEFVLHAVVSPPEVTDAEPAPRPGRDRMRWLEGERVARGRYQIPREYEGTPRDSEVTGSRCSGPLGRANFRSFEYWEAAAETGGQQYSICADDWSPLFAAIADDVEVSASLPCALELPEPPAGMSFDSNAVNVLVRRGGEAQSLGRVNGEGDCGSRAAWYYDNNGAPTTIQLCPEYCSSLEDEEAELDIQLGCESVLI